MLFDPHVTGFHLLLHHDSNRLAGLISYKNASSVTKRNHHHYTIKYLFSLSASKLPPIYIQIMLPTILFTGVVLVASIVAAPVRNNPTRSLNKRATPIIGPGFTAQKLSSFSMHIGMLCSLRATQCLSRAPNQS